MVNFTETYLDLVKVKSYTLGQFKGAIIVHDDGINYLRDEKEGIKTIKFDTEHLEFHIDKTVPDMEDAVNYKCESKGCFIIFKDGFLTIDKNEIKNDYDHLYNLVKFDNPVKRLSFINSKIDEFTKVGDKN